MGYSYKTWADGVDGGTRVTAAELQRMEDGIVAGTELDSVEVGVTFDVMTLANTTYTDVPGANLIIGPTPRPYMINVNFMGTMGTGTSVAGTGLSLFLALYEYTSGTGLWGYTQMTVTQRNPAAAFTESRPLTINRRMAPQTTTRYFKLQARQSQGTPTGWGATQLYAHNAPYSGIYPPNNMWAVSL